MIILLLKNYAGVFRRHSVAERWKFGYFKLLKSWQLDFEKSVLYKTFLMPPIHMSVACGSIHKKPFYFPNPIKFKNIHGNRRAGPRRGCWLRHNFYSLLLVFSETHGKKINITINLRGNLIFTKSDRNSKWKFPGSITGWRGCLLFFHICKNVLCGPKSNHWFCFLFPHPVDTQLLQTLTSPLCVTATVSPSPCCLFS